MIDSFSHIPRPYDILQHCIIYVGDVTEVDV